MRAVIWTVAGFAFFGLPAAGLAAGGDGAAEDPRWLPWIGCWESMESAGGEDEAPLLVCFRELADRGGVEITTHSDGEVVAREEVRSDGQSVPVQEGGCEGEQWAEWSADGKRLFVHSRMACSEGMIRATKGVLSIQDSGSRWVEIHAVTAGDAEPLLAITSFRPARSATVERAGVRAADEGRRLAVATARTAAARALVPADVAESVHQVGSEVTRALIVESGHRFALDARTLRTLKADGVPEDVLDVMVAVSYPERFAIEGGTQDPVYRTAERVPGYGPAYPVGPRRRGYSLWGSRYYGYGMMYGYSPYGFGGWGYPGGYWGAPIVIVQPPTVRDRARAVPGRGYVAPGASSRGAVRRDGAAPAGQQSRPARADAPPRREASPAPRSASPPPRAAPSRAPRENPPERRARPRGGSGGGEG